MLRRLGDGVPLDQNIFATKFILWIASFRGVAMRLHAVMKIENLGGITEGCVDFFFCPDIKRAFAVLRFAMLEKAIGVFRGKKSAFLCRHVAGDVVEDIPSNRCELSILRNL